MIRYISILLACFIMNTFATGTDGWMLHSNWGFNHAFDSVLSVNTTDKDIVHQARWDGKSFIDSPYYTIRIEHWSGDKVSGWEWVHYKMYLDNNPSDIQSFSISDGYNMLFYNIGHRSKTNWIRKVGAGIIMAHPDVTLLNRERFWNKGGLSGAYLAGVAVQTSLETWVHQTDRHVFSIEGKLSAGYARIPISKNTAEFADVPHIAFHLTFGMGSKPLKNTSASSLAWYVAPPLIHHYAIYKFKDL